MAGNREPVAVARIRNQVGQLVGSGFLVAPDLVLTCTHVVLAALGADFAAGSPDDAVDLDFPLADGTARAQAHVLGWTAPDTGSRGDIALLKLTAAPGGQLPAARLRPVRIGRDEPVRIFGYALQRAQGPGDVIRGVAVSERAGLLQITTEGELQVERGFSGSPVYHPVTGAVAGMVVTAVSGKYSCNAVPIDAVLDTFPQLGEPDPAAGSPYRGLEPFEERHAAWFKGRDAVIDRLATAVRKRPLLIVMGPSGSGKSSLIRAGLVPVVRARAAKIVTARLRPGERVETLVARLIMPVLDPDAEDPARLAERLRTEPADTLATLAGELDDRAGDDGLLLFVDQLEEAPPEAVHAAIVLLDGLVRAARRRPDGSIRIAAVVTLRAGVLEETLSAEIAGAVNRARIELVPPMSRDELRAAIRAGDVGFEDGLDERILADAGSEPGRLPLIEFTLELLWQRRRRFDELTVEAYEELGGVSGALATYADQVLDQQPEDDRERIRTVLTAMARPSDDGAGFRRRPLDLSGLAEPDRAVVDELAARRLVVVTQPDDRAAFAEPAHQALLESWPTLAEWLAKDRDFLIWREQLRSDRDRWAAAGQDPDALLRGMSLSAARQWAGERGPDLSADDLGFVQASQNRERRRVRVLRTVIAVVSVLALVAGSFAVLAARSNAELRERAQATASRQLAAHSLRFRDTDPAKALQFAQAAWHTHKTSEAYGALLTQYAALDQVDRIFQGLWSGTAEQIRTSDDGRVALITGSVAPTVVTGLTSDEPALVALPGADTMDELRVDPTGRYIAGADSDGSVALWNLDRPGTPRLLVEPVDADVPDPRRVGSLAFSRDGTRLLVYRPGSSFPADTAPDEATHDLRVWDVADGRQVRSAVSLPPTFSTIAFGPSAGTVAVPTPEGLAVHDLATGRIRRTIPGGLLRVAEHGASVVECLDQTLRVRETATGAVRQGIPRTRCEQVDVDSTTTMAVLDARVYTGDTSTTLTMVALDGGNTYRGIVPPVPDPAFGPTLERLAIGRGAGGVPVALSIRNDALYRTALAVARPVRVPEGVYKSAAWVITPDRRSAVTFYESGRIDVSDAATGGPVSRVQGRALIPKPDVSEREREFAVTTDSRHLLVTEPGGLAAYSLPGLNLLWRRDLPAPDLSSLAPGSSSNMLSSVAVTGPDRATILHHGILTSWTISTGEPDGSPIPLGAGDARSRFYAGFTRIREVHPRDPNRIVVSRLGGSAEIWDLGRRAPVDDELPSGISAHGSAAAFAPDGKRLAVLAETEIEVWDLDAGQRRRPIRAGGASTEVLGFTPAGHLVTAPAGNPEPVQVWDVDAGLMLAEIEGTEQDSPWTLRGDVLANHSPAGSRIIPLNPDTWFQRLCALSARDFTAEERELLQRDDAPIDLPCS